MFEWIPPQGTSTSDNPGACLIQVNPKTGSVTMSFWLHVKRKSAGSRYAQSTAMCRCLRTVPRFTELICLMGLIR